MRPPAFWSALPRTATAIGTGNSRAVVPHVPLRLGGVKLKIVRELHIEPQILELNDLKPEHFIKVDAILFARQTPAYPTIHRPPPLRYGNRAKTFGH